MGLGESIKGCNLWQRSPAASLQTHLASGMTMILGAAGKTHTMQGPPEDPGVYQRALQELFAATGGNAPDGGAAPPGGHISVAMLEIYNDDARDLLADAVTGKAASLDVSALGAGQLPPGEAFLPCVWTHV